MKFRNYKNKHTNDNVIHSYENLMGMTFDEITDRANELGTQYKQIGLPTNSELNSSPNAVYVHAYTKDDGTQVRAHWRSKPEGGIIANQIQNGISIPSYNNGIFGDLNKETFPHFDSGIFGNVNNTNIPTFDNGGEVENNGVDVNNQNLQNAIAPILLPMILSQIPMPNMQTQQNVPTGYASDIDTSQINNYVGNETATPVYAENGVLKGNIAENVNFGKNNNVLQTIFNDYKGLEDPMNTILYAIGAFLTNYFELKDADTKKADKYFHARANYEAAQQGIVGSITAKIISDLRELSDSYRNINEKKYSKEESEQDILEDQAANELGRRLGRENPTINAFEILKFLMPNGFPERYRHR